MKKFLKTIIFDFFYLVLGSYILATLLEKMKPGVISNHFDLNKSFYIIIPMIILCAIASSWRTNKTKTDDKI